MNSKNDKRTTWASIASAIFMGAATVWPEFKEILMAASALAIALLGYFTNKPA